MFGQRRGLLPARGEKVPKGRMRSMVFTIMLTLR